MERGYKAALEEHSLFGRQLYNLVAIRVGALLHVAPEIFTVVLAVAQSLCVVAGIFRITETRGARGVRQAVGERERHAVGGGGLVCFFLFHDFISFSPQ